MRRIQISNGHTGTLRLKVIDTDAADLTSVTWKIALLAPNVDPPAPDDVKWRSPSNVVHTGPGVAILSLTITDSTEDTGQLWAWVMPTNASDLAPVKAADDVIVLV